MPNRRPAAAREPACRLRHPTDIEASPGLARDSAARPQATAASPLRIFITLEMPREPAAADRSGRAQRRGPRAAGPEGELDARDLAAVSSLIGERQVAWVIDPEAFARHRIERADLRAESRRSRRHGDELQLDCRTPPAFVSVSGDVSLDHALDTLARQRPEARPLVAPAARAAEGP